MPIAPALARTPFVQGRAGGEGTEACLRLGGDLRGRGPPGAPSFWIARAEGGGVAGRPREPGPGRASACGDACQPDTGGAPGSEEGLAGVRALPCPGPVGLCGPAEEPACYTAEERKARVQPRRTVC